MLQQQDLPQPLIFGQDTANAQPLESPCSCGFSLYVFETGPVTVDVIGSSPVGPTEISPAACDREVE